MIIRQYLVPTTKARTMTSGTGNTRRKICIHETDNTNRGANADAHSRLQARGNSRKASWHWQVDDKEAIQSFTHEWRCWAAGSSKGNNEAIHIEICVNSDGDYKKAVQNAAKLVAKILKEEQLTINDIVQHNYYSGKNCPRIMRKGNIISWNQFLTMVKESGGLTVSQYKELKSEIQQLKNEIQQYKNILNNKADINSTKDSTNEGMKEAMEWAIKEGLIIGTGKSYNPKGALTREQLATILKRYHEKYIKNNSSK